MNEPIGQRAHSAHQTQWHSVRVSVETDNNNNNIEDLCLAHDTLYLQSERRKENKYCKKNTSYSTWNEPNEPSLRSLFDWHAAVWI